MNVSAPITLLQPSRIVFGADCIGAVAELLAARQTRRLALITTARGLAQAQRFCTNLRDAGAEVVPFTEVPAEPPLGAFEQLRTALDRDNVDAVLGWGGGSVLDVAKLLAALHRSDTATRDVIGIGRLDRRALPLVCVPTTAGTGSEVSPNSILLDEEARLKVGVISPHLVPDAAVIDPQLTVSAPPALTATTGIDALVHCLEAFANRHAHPLVDLYALEGLRLIATHLPTAVRDGHNLAARTAVARGSLYGGLCLGPVNTAAVHALAYPLGSAFHVPHGLANALLLPHVLRFNLPAALERYAAVARALGVTSNGPRSPQAEAEAGLLRLEQLLDDCAVPRRLREFGVSQSDIPALVSGAMQVTRLLCNNPREVSPADATAIYEAALAA